MKMIMQPKIKIQHLITNLQKWSYNVYPEYKVPEYEAKIFSEFCFAVGNALMVLIGDNKDEYLDKVKDMNIKYDEFNIDINSESLKNTHNILLFAELICDLADEMHSFELYSIKDYKLDAGDAKDIITAYLLARKLDLYEFEDEKIEKHEDHIEEKEEDDEQKVEEDMQEPKC